MTLSELFEAVQEFIILMKMPNLIYDYNSESEDDEESYDSGDNFIEKDSDSDSETQ